jgi:hypothetical protein
MLSVLPKEGRILAIITRVKIPGGPELLLGAGADWESPFKPDMRYVLMFENNLRF